MKKVVRLFLPGVVLLVSNLSVFGFVLEGAKWPGPTIPMVVQVGQAPFILPDGSLSWNASAENAFQIWNEQMRDVQFTWTEQDPGANQPNVTQVLFSSGAYNYNFDSDTLAVTLLKYSGGVMHEADVLFNNGINWTSSGTVVPGRDFHRVALHEFGHVIGLDHPDQNHQNVSSIMNANVSGITTLTADDAAGAHALYGAPANAPPTMANARLANISTRAVVGTGDKVLIAGFILRDQTKPVLIRALGPTLTTFGVGGAVTDPTLSLNNQGGSVLFSNDDWADSQQSDIQQTGLPPPDQREAAIKATLAPASYTAIASGKDNTSGVGLIEVYDLETTSGKAYNISTRGIVGGGENVMIAGFVIKGPQNDNLVIRGIGPGLQGLVNGFVPDTKLELRNSQGQVITTNVGWQSDANQGVVGFYKLAPTSPKDSAIYAQLVPGSYTVVFSSPSNATGVGLIEVYDVTTAPSEAQ